MRINLIIIVLFTDVVSNHLLENAVVEEIGAYVRCFECETYCIADLLETPLDITIWYYNNVNLERVEAEAIGAMKKLPSKRYGSCDTDDDDEGEVSVISLYSKDKLFLNVLLLRSAF